jgi:predicted O-methyltransferase YrrM
MSNLDALIKNSSVISLLKNKAPGLYRAGFSAYFRLKALLDTPRYLWCRASRSVYFGPVMLGAQTWESRAPYMCRALARAIANCGNKTDVRVLEIGSWAGHSAILWATELIRSGCSGKVFCVDPWMPFLKPGQLGNNTAASIMDHVARRDRIFPLFWHNVKAARQTEVIVPLRGTSRNILPLFQPATFDLLFVDGSHSFSDFMADLALAAPLVREGGIICGDDLELQLSEADPQFTLENCEKDFATDPRTQTDYHPGVCLGVSKFFQKRVSCHNGFWLMKKRGEIWENMDVS